jgi:hypothetical protein
MVLEWTEMESPGGPLGQLTYSPPTPLFRTQDLEND